MATAKDRYRQKLGEIIGQLEMLYGLGEQNELGVAYVELDIETIMEYENQLIMGLSTEDKKVRNLDAGKSIVLISYIKDRLEFYGRRKLDYSEYPRADVIAQCLLRFTEKDTISGDALNNLNMVVYILQEIDNKLVSHKFGLGYRYLRMFIVFALWGNYCNASVLAKFIINQLVLREG